MYSQGTLQHNIKFFEGFTVIFNFYSRLLFFDEIPKLACEKSFFLGPTVFGGKSENYKSS